jgi:transposase
VHLAHPLGVNAFKTQRVKQDHTDVRHLADLLRRHRRLAAWIAPVEVRELRELIRCRAKLVALRSGCKSQVHAVLGKFGVKVTMSDLFGVSGLRLLDDTALPPVSLQRVDSLRGLIETIDAELWALEAPIQARLRGHHGYQAIQRIPGVGPVLGALASKF